MDIENPLETLRIVLVEDNRHDVIAFRRAFQKSNVECNITHYERADEALKRITSDAASFDLAVTDYKLPGMSGLDFCRELIASGILLPVVLLTGAGSENLAIEALKLGAYDYIIKDQNQGYLELLPVVLTAAVRKHNTFLARREMEKKVRESEQKYRNLYEGSRDGFAMVNMDGKILESNKSFIEMLGYSNEELGNLTYQDITPQKWHSLEAGMLTKVLQDGYTPLYRKEYRSKDGTIIPVELRGYLLKDNDGNSTGIWAFVRDITAQLEADQKLRQQAHDLNERVKELKCLYGLSEIIAKYGNSQQQIMQRTIEMIPASWQYPEITCGRITTYGDEFKTQNFRESEWRQASDIIVSGETIGSLEVFYLDKREQMDEGPFLNKERNLIDAVASRLGRTLERIQAEERLKQDAKLNAALSELYAPLISPASSIEEIATTVLDKAKNLTNSEHGFVSTIDPITGDNVSHTLTEMFKGECKISPDKGIAFPRRADGCYPSLWGHALNTGEPFFTNTAENHTAAAGIPDGHIPIQRFLTVPVMLGRELVGQIALANKAEDYTAQNLEAVGRVAEFYALAIQRNRSREELQKAHAELEQRVEERTAEIKQAYRQLVEEAKGRKFVQEQLGRSKAMLQAVFDGISEPLILVDKYMKLKMFNRAAADYYGFENDETVIGEFCYQATGKTDLCEGCQIAEAVQKGQGSTLERNAFRQPDRLERIVVYPISDDEEETGDAILRITDITEEKKFERHLIQSEKMASLGILVSSIAHEINNPNSFVSFNIPILKDYIETLLPIVDEYAKKHADLEMFNMPYNDFRMDIFKLLENIEHGSKRISSFISNLREYSLGKDKNPIKEVDLTSILEKVESMCRSKIKKSVKSFVKNLPENLPAIYTDPYALEQVLINLLLNAAHAADKKDSWIRLEVKINSGSKDHTIIEVIDNGCGMDEKTQLSVFDPFFTTKTPPEGTGLGLYVSHNLIRELGGRIEVESKIGSGSKFTVILPEK